MRTVAMAFKGRNTIEHYHDGLFEKFGLAVKDRKGRRRMLGHYRHRFWYALGDLLWNTLVGVNLTRARDAQVPRREITFEDQFDKTLRNARNVAKRRSLRNRSDKGRAPPASENANGDLPSLVPYLPAPLAI